MIWYTFGMTTSDGVKEIQKAFDINSIYAKWVFALADKKNLIWAVQF